MGDSHKVYVVGGLNMGIGFDPLQLQNSALLQNYYQDALLYQQQNIAQQQAQQQNIAQQQAAYHQAAYHQAAMVNMIAGLAQQSPPACRVPALKRVAYLPNTLGWRAWGLSQATRVGGADLRYLQSPQQKTMWELPELRCDNWDEQEVVRGSAGIHALLAPKLWRHLEWREQTGTHGEITGLVERFGRFVLGEDGWRAEWVIVRELLAPDADTAAQLARAYPEVIIHIEGED